MHIRALVDLNLHGVAVPSGRTVDTDEDTAAQRIELGEADGHADAVDAGLENGDLIVAMLAAAEEPAA